MGDGGVACVPSQHVMEPYSVSETFCGGSKHGEFNPKLLNAAERRMNTKTNMKREGPVEFRTSQVESFANSKNTSSSNKEVENGEINDEVEEGELGSLTWPEGEVENGEFIPEKPHKFEIRGRLDKGEIVVDNWRERGVKKGEIFPRSWRRGEVDNGKFSLDKYNNGELEHTESRPWRSPKEELEKGEFIPERWHNSELNEDDNSYSKMHRYASSRNKVWKLDYERTPPFPNCAGDKEFSRRSGQFTKSSSRSEANQERKPRISSKIVDEEGSLKSEYHSKSHGREYSTGNRLKRHGSDSDSCDRRYYTERDDYTISKSRRISDDGTRAPYVENYDRSSTEKPHKNMSSNRYSSKVVSHRHNSSYQYKRSPHDHDQARHHAHRSPAHHDRSYDRGHYHDRNVSPSYYDRSPEDQARYHDRRDRTPNFQERSPLNLGRPYKYKETHRTLGSHEKRQGQHGKKLQEDKHRGIDPDEGDSEFSVTGSQNRINLGNGDKSQEKKANCESYKEELSCSPSLNISESVQVNGPPEELISMEEDMDICDTPPHVPVVQDSNSGKWFYLDHYGMDQGPSRLSDLKMLVEDGILVSDHLIKHLDSDRWVTVENAVSPLVTSTLPSVISDTVTQSVTPPEAPGNSLADTGDVMQSGSQIDDGMEATSEPLIGKIAAVEATPDFHLDRRVGALLEGCTVIPGREIDTIGEVLQMTFADREWERFGCFEEEYFDKKGGKRSASHLDVSLKGIEASSSAPPIIDNDSSLASGDCLFGRWSSKGGDWKRNDEAAQDRSYRKKYVLNDGYPLCLMQRSGHEDPRLHRKDELYSPSSRRLDLPLWAFSSSDEFNESASIINFSHGKSIAARGVRGTMLPVVRINACVVMDHGSFVSEPRTKSKVNNRHSLWSSKTHSSVTDAKRKPSEESGASLKNMDDQDSQESRKSITSINIPKDRLCTADDLQLHMGEWYYLDGTGHEQGPLLSSEIQVLAEQGIIQKHTSVFRRVDNIWVPVISVAHASQAAGKIQRDTSCMSSDNSGAYLSASRHDALNGTFPLSSFDTLHPHYIGYTRGKLHELVMKSYKSREFAAAIKEVLDPWINAQQPRKEIEKHSSSLSVNRFQRPDQYHVGKRARFLVDGNEKHYELEEDQQPTQNNECLFEDLFRDATFCKEENADTEIQTGCWDLLDSLVLARIFHFLRADIKSLVNAALTCKKWRYMSKLYKDLCVQVNLSSLAPYCTDSMVSSILDGFNKEKITSLELRGCTNITSGMLEEILQLLPSISSVDIRGCSQFEDLISRFPHIIWVKGCVSHSTLSLNLINERTSSVFRTSNGIGGQNEDSNGLREYLESSSMRDSTNQLFRRSLYKRSKLFDTRKSSSMLSRGVHLRRLGFKNSENGYKKMEEFLTTNLRGIMKQNTFDFFVPKVAEIEHRVENGYYARHGLSSVKEDISRMCRDAMKRRNRVDTRNMNHIISLFVRLATSLDGSSRSSYETDEMMKIREAESPPGFNSASSNYKKINKLTGKKYTIRSNGSSFINGVPDSEVYASDGEIKRHLSKLNKRSMDLGSESSKGSSEETETDNTSSSESELDFESEGRAKESGRDGYSNANDVFETFADDREWGARMTKASLVPPVTRKYEVIDQYVIVADQEEVKRKMWVSLPDEYKEKLDAQKNGTEESDMEIPEVKDYKPRKQLGHEVLEQEVYGIDPYTHNLLLDSMPDDSDWSLSDKHVFIEDVLLRTLNKQVRSFTGTEHTPIKYQLEPVIQDILKTSEKNHDTSTVRVCQYMLNSMGSRPEDNYVAYRKGLGVVCNKEGGFVEDDFVVEFLGEVYPAWKWFEKQDGIRSLQKNSKEPAPEFYNIYLERPKGDADGYDLVVVDAMHKANYASRICHSCRPNCEAKVTAVDGQYQIGIYTVRPIGYGEEVTFDYNSVTESKEEYEASVCLCGSQICRGSYLNLTGEGAFQKVLKDCHGILDRHQLMLEACELNSVSEEDYIDLGKAGLGSCLLGGLPDWLIAYSARLVRFINSERVKLPNEILRHNVEEKKKYFTEICLDVEKSDAEVQAEGVYNQRLQNLALTLDKVRYVMRCVFGDPKKAPPPLERLSPEEAVSYVWKGEGSLVEELLLCMAPYVEDSLLNDLKTRIRAHDPSGSDDTQRELRKSLKWLRDEVRNLQCSYKCRHDAAADLIHLYAYTKCFFRIREYKSVTSPPVYITPLDLGPKYSDKLGSDHHEYCKTYGENYCLGQLIFWHNQTYMEPDCGLAKARRGCLSLPDIGSFYAKVNKPSRQRIYGPRTLKLMLARMEKQPQRPWPSEEIWSFENSSKVFGSPMLDAVLHNAPLDKEMVHWLKHRIPIFHARWDR